MLFDVTAVQVLFQLAHVVCNYNQLHKFNSFSHASSSCRNGKREKRAAFVMQKYQSVFSWFQLAINIYWEIIIGSHCHNSSFLSVNMQDQKPILLCITHSLMNDICRIGYFGSKYFQFVRLTILVHPHPIDYLLSFFVLKYILLILIIIIKDTVSMHSDQK